MSAKRCPQHWDVLHRRTESLMTGRIQRPPKLSNTPLFAAFEKPQDGSLVLSMIETGDNGQPKPETRRA
ncbi:hypothetical protein Bca4012_009993 [Brassica carinata]